MSDVTEIKCWPNGPFALDWSHDNLLALTSEDQVYILFPNKDCEYSDNDLSQWRHLAIQVPWFTKEELPKKEPATSALFSIGEEISASYPVQLAWSPPGLAKHRRCAIAVLTSNLVLSIWASAGKVGEETDWDRRVIVNNALEDAFFTAMKEKGEITAAISEDEVRLWRRIRAFSWATAITSEESTPVVGTQLSWGGHMVAVSNDANHIVIVGIISPTTTLFMDDTWSVEVLSQFAYEPQVENDDSQPGTFDSILQQQQHISQLAWSPWARNGQHLQSVIAFATNDSVRARVVKYYNGSIIIGPEILCLKEDIRYAGPMKWLPSTREGVFTLAIFNNNDVTNMSISVFDATVLDRVNLHLEGLWDTLSGVVFDTSDKDTPILHLSSLMSTTSNETTGFMFLSSVAAPPVTSPQWHRSICDSQALFSAQNDLQGNVIAKVWGLATSPSNDYIASVHTLHPSDMIEYGPPADRLAFVNISRIRGGKDDKNVLRLPRENVSAGTIMFSIRKWWEGKDNVINAGSEEAQEEKAEVLRNMIQTYTSPHSYSLDSANLSAEPGDSFDVDLLTAGFKRNVFLEANMLVDRYDILISPICSPSQPVDLARTMIAYRLAKGTYNLPASLSSSSDFSQQIRALSHNVMQYVHKLSAGDEARAQPPTNTRNLEACNFCNAEIPLTDLSSAMCTNGHQFNRCGLSFLAIQMPSISKYCGTCNTPFFSDEYVLLQEASSTRTSEELDRASLQIGADQGGPIVPGLSSGLPRTDETVEQRQGSSGEMMEDQAEAPREDASSRWLGRSDIVKDRKVQKEVPLTLARVLFLACDVCVYCGGKYVG